MTAFEVVDRDTGGVVYISSDPPDVCYEGSCGGCDACFVARAGDGYFCRDAREWVAWTGWTTCRWCCAGRYLGGRCERCNERDPATIDGPTMMWSSESPDPLAASLMFERHLLTPHDLVSLHVPQLDPAEEK